MGRGLFTETGVPKLDGQAAKRKRKIGSLFSKLECFCVLTILLFTQDVEILVGNDIANVEALRFQLKSPFDRDVITHIDTVETVLDYSFSHMGIDSEGSVNHPIVMTEAVCNPSLSRQFLNELLFECYQIPSLSLGIDALFSLQQNVCSETLPTSLVVRLGYQATHIIPILGSR